MRVTLNHAAGMALFALAVGGVSSAAAEGDIPGARGDGMPSRAEMWQMLQQQQREIAALKGRQGSPQAVEPAAAEQPASPGINQKWSDRITISGVVEVEAGVAEDFAGVNSSDLTVATVELALDVKLHDWVNAHVLLLHEEDDTELVDVEEGTITIGNPDRSPVYLTAGRMGVPFGNFTSNLLSDPLTLELGEAVESAVQVGFARNNWYGSIYLFNGDANVVGSDSNLEQFGGNIGYLYESDAFNLDVGASYINSMEDSDGISGVLGTTTSATVTTAVDTMVNHISGVGAHAILTRGPMTAIGEYLTATEDFSAGKMAWNGHGARPKAWNTELGYSLDFEGREIGLSAAWQGTGEALALGFPKDRVLIGASMGIYENTGLALEWYRSEDYKTVDGGTGRDDHSTTLQMAVAF